MKYRNFFILFFLLFSMQISAQKNFFLKGYVRDSTDLIVNAHIVNISKEKGTFSNDFGVYKIVVSIGDTLEVSSVQHEFFRTVVTEQMAFSKELRVVLKRRVIELDEIILKRHNLTGILRSDRKQVPKDSIAAVGRSISDVISELAAKEKALVQNVNASDKGTAGVITKKTDPTKKFDGVGTSIGLGNGKNKKDEEIKKIISDKFTSQIILDKFGKDFFSEINIPENQIFAFIDYCKKFDIKGLYNKGYLLQIAVLLQRESPAFLKSIKE